MTDRKHRLDARLWRAFVLQIVLISATAVVGVYLAEFAIRELLIVSALEREADYFWSRRNIARDTPAPNTNSLIGYVFERDSAETPQEFKGLPLGIHDLITPVVEGVVHVSEQDRERLYLVFDANNVQQLATYFGVAPLALMLVVLYCSAWAAYLIARRAVSPVIRLSRMVRDLDVETPDLAAFEAAYEGQGTDSEIQTLTKALHNLMARVDQFVERERTFTREASHELRSPLTVIRMASDTLLNRRTLDDGVRDMVEKIQRAAQDMEELTEALLVLARDYEGAVEHERVSINDVLKHEIARCRMIYQDRQINLRFIEKVRLSVKAPPKVAGIVFGNLISNACAYTDEGTVSVTIHAAGVSIDDSGIGMSKEHLGRVFTRYFRASNARGGGHGIGLSLVKRITDRIGWTIEIASEPHKGTHVEISMPLAYQETAEASADRVVAAS
jgi:signal transduction histidine kinase